MENEIKYESGKWLLHQLKTDEFIGEWDVKSKVFTSNVGGWATSEYPVNRIAAIEIYKYQLTRHKKEESNEKIKVIALILTTDKQEYLYKNCITLEQVLDFINSDNEEYIIGSISETDLIHHGGFCPIIGMHDAGPSSKHDCDNRDAREVYGENVFRFWT